MIKLYQRETCPYCKPIRERLTELNISYININLPKVREERKQLIDITGNPYIPSLVDGETVITGKEESYKDVLEYINRKFSKHN